MARSGLFAKMHMTRRAFVVWLAVFALFAQALSPLSVAWAFEPQPDGAQQFICTVSGVQAIAVGQDGKPIDPQNVAACPFCVLHISAAVLNPFQASPLLTNTGETEQAFGLPRADVHATLWRAQPRPPRGPPRTA